MIVLALVALGAVVAGVIVVAVLALGGRGEAGHEGEDAGGEREDREAAADFAATSHSAVVLEDNVWSACTFDGITSEWGRFAEEPRGFGAVPAGRHRVVTRTPAGDATLDFVLYPGETFARRLDPGAARWVEIEATATTPEHLIGYRTTFGVARVQSGAKVVISSDVVARACARLDALVAKGEGAALAEAVEIGETLVGVPLTRAQLRALGDCIAGPLDRARAAGDPARTARLAALGLCVLPGDARFSAAAASAA